MAPRAFLATIRSQGFPKAQSPEPSAATREAAGPFLGGSRDDPQSPLRDAGERRADCRRGARRRNHRLVGLPQRRRRRPHEGDARRVQQGARRQGQDRRDHPRMGRAVLHQGADLGRDRPGPRRHDLSRIAHAARRLDRRAERAHARGTGRRRHQGERLRPRQLEGGAGPGRQAIRRAARYPLDHPLLQQGHAEEGGPARRRRQAEGPRRRRRTSTPRSPSSPPTASTAFRCRTTAAPAGASSTRCSTSRAASSSRTASSSTATISTRRPPRSPRCRSGPRTNGRRRTPNIRPRSRSSPPARRRCTSTASGRCRRWSTSPRRASSSTGARSRFRSSSRSRRPGRIRTPSPSPTARAIR